MVKFTPVILLLVIACNNNQVEPPPVIIKGDSIVNNDSTGNVLRGTTILQASQRNMNSHWSYGLTLSGFSGSDCKGAMPEEPPPTTITSAEQPDDSTLIITANVYENCAYDFLGEIEVINNNTLNLIYHGYGGFASCSCCFGLTYTIDLMDQPEFDLKKLKYVTLNGLVKTKLPPIKGSRRRSYY